jgi:hypothetical protein
MRPVLLLVAVFALVSALLAWGRWLAGRRWAAVGHLFATLAATVVLLALWPLAGYLSHFEPRAADRPVAEIFSERIAAGRHRVMLTRLPSGRMQVMEVEGDEWRLDLQTLEWSDRLEGLGLTPRLRIAGLAARPTPGDAAHAAGGTTHRLAESVASPWPIRLPIPGGAPALAVHEVSGPWLPLLPGARFELRVGPGRTVVAEPRNAAAAEGLARS